MTVAATGTLRSIRRQLGASLAAAVFLVGGVGGWASMTELAGAVIAPGTLVVDSDVKKVQHPTGGVIGELRVREGDEVRAGDILLRLDETITQANLAIIVQSLDELAAKRARLEAERDGEGGLSLPADLSARASEPAIARLLAGERRLFEVRRAARAGQKAQLEERIGQLREQIQGTTEQVAAKNREVELIGQELEGVRELGRKNLVPITRVNALERDAARLRGEWGMLVSSIAQAKGRISETTLQILQIDQDLRSEVSKDLAEIRAKTSELIERRVTAEDQLNHIDIRAPQDGRVHQLAVHTVGGVVSPGEPIMLIVPGADRLVAEVRIAPHDIDQIQVGQMVRLRLPAFNLRTTPELKGEVIRVAADITQDQKTSAAFYTVRVGLPDDEVARLNGVKLVPGMPLEVFVQTGERTVMSYLLKPVSDQIVKGWRER
jgi:HlyD family secretion protein